MEEFIKLVKDMRTTQKEYFKSRSGASLSKARMLERQVDAKIEAFNNPDLFA